MNAIKMTIIVATLAVTGLASAALDPLTYVVELGYESSPVPAHEADRMTVKRCHNCAEDNVRFSTQTAYRLNGFNSQAVTLLEFSQAVRQIDDKDGLLFYVRFEADTKLVTDLVLNRAE